MGRKLPPIDHALIRPLVAAGATFRAMAAALGVSRSHIQRIMQKITEAGVAIGPANDRRVPMQPGNSVSWGAISGTPWRFIP